MTITLSNLDLHEFLDEIGHSRLDNYILPGLSSTLLSGADVNVRMFKNSRPSDGVITPHSHRFSLGCCVMQGEVTNWIYLLGDSGFSGQAEYQATTLRYDGKPGHYEFGSSEFRHYRRYGQRFVAGEWYFMRHTDIHSIEFSQDARVLIIEGPDVSNETTILEPVVNGKVVPTFEVKPWMFQKAA